MRGAGQDNEQIIAAERLGRERKPACPPKSKLDGESFWRVGKVSALEWEAER